jgi:hypothetical protein
VNGRLQSSGLNTTSKAIRLVLSVAALVVVFVAHGMAQVRRAGAAGSIRPVTARAGAISVGAAGRIATPLQPNFAPLYTVPGLSFNIQALAATGRRDIGRRRGQVAPPFLQYYPFYTPYADYSYDAQPPYDVGPAPQTEAAPPAQPEPSEPPSTDAVLQPPPPDVGQFVLVRLDGKVVFAAAFMSANGSLTYVTREGVRRSFPLAELDKDATRQMNEANGMSVSLPD